MKKTVFSILTAAALIISVFVLPAQGNYNGSLEKDFYSDCALLVSADRDEVVFSKNPDKQTKPASLTKVVTACVVLEECPDITASVTVPQKCIDELQGTGSSLGGLKGGEILSVHDLLCCLLVQSANEAATTLANFITGDDRQAFVDKMNALAEKLGCLDSHFTNVHGLDDDDQYVTANDMAKFFKHAMEYSVFADIVSKASYDLPATNLQAERTIRTTNFTLLSGYKEYYCRYSVGGKTGTTSGAGSCLVSMASNDGYNYIAVALKAEKKDFDNDGVDENGAFMDTQAMYDWAFENLRLVSIADSSAIVGEIPVKFGKGADYVSLSPADTAFALMPKGIDAGSLLIKPDKKTEPEFVHAPVEKGEVLCQGDIYYAGEVVTRIDLVASTEIRRSVLSSIGSAIAKVFESPLFRLIFIAAAALLGVLIFLGRRRAQRAEKREYNVVGYNDFVGKGKKNKR